MKHPYNLTNLEASFKDFLLAENISKVTIKNYLSDIRFFAGWLSSYNRPLEQSISFKNVELSALIATLDEHQVKVYKTYLIESQLPIQTINRRLSSLRKFCDFCLKLKLLEADPTIGIQNIKHSVSTSLEQITLSFKDLAEEFSIDNKFSMGKSQLEDVKEFITVTYN